MTAGVRQIYPGHALLGDASLAALYAYPAQGRWLRANMVASLDGAATVRGRTGGLSGEADRQVFALLRALADVILVGAGTARVEGYGPVRPESEGVQWAWLRQGRPPSSPIAVITRRLHLDPDSPLIAEAPAHAPTIVITTEAAPVSQRAAVSRTAEVIVAGETDVDLGVAADALVRRGYPRILTEGGPHLLGQISGAGLLDELCLTVSPLLTGPGAGRIVAAMGSAGQPDSRDPRPLALAHVIADDGYLLCRYLRSA
ncbi:MAG TPA: pyrimidine reductase family protein [Streptosporangiaceae bacterium]